MPSHEMKRREKNDKQGPITTKYEPKDIIKPLP